MSKSRIWLATSAALGSGLFLASGAAAQVTYTDALNDITGPMTTPPNYVDLSSVVVSNDSSNITFQINVNPTADLTDPTQEYADYLIGIQTGPGGSTDLTTPYSDAIGISTGMNLFIGGFAGAGFGAGANVFSCATGDVFTQLPAAGAVTYPGVLATNSLTLTIPLSTLGFTPGTKFNFDVWTTFGNPGGEGAYDALDNPNFASGAGVPYTGGTLPETSYDSATAPGSTFSTTTYTVTAAGQTGTWNVAGGGSWAASGNWLNGIIPQNPGDTANFDNSITIPSTVTLDANQSIGALNFNSPISYTLAAGTGGILTLDNSGATATVTDAGGTHSISAPVVLNSNSIFSVTNSTDALKISGSISGTGSLTVAGSGTVTLSGNNNYSGGTSATSGSLVIGAAGALPNGSLTVGTATTTATVKFAASIGKQTVSSLVVSTGSVVDIANNSVVINYPSGNSPLTALHADLLAGYNGGKWNGTGIISSNAAAKSGAYAIGFADGSTDKGTPAAADQIFLKYDLVGDTNLDGTVNLTDLLALLNSYGQTGTDWVEGDTNYDGTVNLTDLLALLNNYGQTASLTSASSTNTDAVPEPASMSLLALGSASLLARRRRSRTRPN